MIPARQGVTGIRFALAITAVLVLYLATREAPVVEAVNDKAKHILAFGAMSLLADFAFPRTPFGWPKRLALLGFGLLIEFWQYFLPYREASSLDVLADCIGIAAYSLGMPLLERIPVLRLLARLRRHLAQANFPMRNPPGSPP